MDCRRQRDNNIEAAQKRETEEIAIEKKVRIKDINRKQLILQPVDIENLVRNDHEVRAIWEFTGKLDLAGYYKKIEAVEGRAGQAAYDPRMLICIWIYAYSKAVSSAREISRLCEYDPAYQWLIGLEVINHHTLSDFRVEHKDELDALFANVLGLLSAEGLVTLERVMHDGTKIKANAGADTFRREKRIQEYLEIAKKQVAEMGDPCSENISRRVTKAKERGLAERKNRLEQALTEFKKIENSRIKKIDREKIRVSMTDPDARIMKQAEGGYGPNYNVQISTDATNGIIVGVDVSQSRDDYNELVNAVEEIEKNTSCMPKQMVVDGGFVSRDNIIKMEEKGIDFIAPVHDGTRTSEGQLKRRGVKEEFYPKKFCFDESKNIYICPAGKELKYEGREKRPGRLNYRYRASFNDCKECKFKEACCPKNMEKGRAIVRSVEDEVVVQFNNKMQTEEMKKIYKERGRVAEFSNLWIKAKIGLRQFCLRGTDKVRIESLWACLTYNIKQWIRLCWKRPQFKAA